MTVSINLVIVLPISDLAPPKHDMTVSCFFHLAIVHLYLDYLRKAAQLVHVYDAECQQQQRHTLVHTYWLEELHEDMTYSDTEKSNFNKYLRESTAFYTNLEVQ